MSYDIYFTKMKDLNLENIYSSLSATPTASDDFFISKNLMRKLKSILNKKGLRFELFESETEDVIELTFEKTYQLSMFNSQIAISLPFFYSPKADYEINKEVKIITDVLIENGFSGFDAQTEKFIHEKIDTQKL